MSVLRLVSLAVLATLIGVSQSQCYGRVPLSVVPPTLPVVAPCYPGPDDMSALLLLAKAVEKPCDDINAGELINKLVNALVYATTNPGGAGGAGGARGAGGSGGRGGSAIPLPAPKPKPKPAPSEDKEPLIDLGLLTGDDLLNLILAGQDLLRLNVGNGKGGGAVTDLVSGLL
ncbi:hypothetical protein ABMA28_011842 [Loxostege sticticalis]|uniref:Secreted protein n=1 Tax=Loxostege sticticalis TaxID=481309 RepID=A0ABD0TKQ0_LOXSC